MTQVLLRDKQQDDNATRKFGRLWNTGNYFFLDAVERQLNFDSVIYSASGEVKADTLVLSMSNFISPTTDMSSFASFIEQNNFERVVMIGAGAQAQNFEKHVQLTAGTQRFLKVLSERSVSIGVRGDYTAYVLEQYGIHNVRIIGCPTLFWSEKPDFQVLPLPEKPTNFSVNITPSGIYRDKMALLLRESVSANAQYISQDENFVAAVGEEAQARRDWVARYYGGCFDDPSELSNWLSQEVHHYSIPAWIDYMKRFDFVCGTRFHGNMAAIQSGIPALNLVCDSRTKELCDFLNLPYLNFGRYRGESLEELANEADFTLFNATYRNRWDNYVEFLDENGLSHNLGEKKNANLLTPQTMDDLPPNEEYTRRMLERYRQDVIRSGANGLGAVRLMAERNETLRSASVGAAADSGKLTPKMSESCLGDSAAFEVLGDA